MFFYTNDDRTALGYGDVVPDGFVEIDEGLADKIRIFLERRKWYSFFSEKEVKQLFDMSESRFQKLLAEKIGEL